MTNVLEFQSIATLKAQLATRDDELAAARGQINDVKSVNEMLKLQMLDMVDQLNGFSDQIQIMQQNIQNLIGKLPQLD